MSADSPYRPLLEAKRKHHPLLLFILQFCRYDQCAFYFQRTLGNPYATQNYDGFITRGLRLDDTYQFHPHDLNSTGPNLLIWSV